MNVEILLFRSLRCRPSFIQIINGINLTRISLSSKYFILDFLLSAIRLYYFLALHSIRIHNWIDTDTSQRLSNKWFLIAFLVCIRSKRPFHTIIRRDREIDLSKRCPIRICIHFPSNKWILIATNQRNVHLILEIEKSNETRREKYEWLPIHYSFGVWNLFYSKQIDKVLARCHALDVMNDETSSITSHVSSRRTIYFWFVHFVLGCHLLMLFPFSINRYLVDVGCWGLRRPELMINSVLCLFPFDIRWLTHVYLVRLATPTMSLCTNIHSRTLNNNNNYNTNARDSLR